MSIKYKPYTKEVCCMLKQVWYAAYAAGLLSMAFSTVVPAQEGEGTQKKLVVSIGGFIDETKSPAWEQIKEIQPLTADYINKIGILQHQSAEDVARINSAREFMQLAVEEGKLEDLRKIAAKGIDKFIYLELVQEVTNTGMVDALYALVVDVETREFLAVPLGAYNNRAAQNMAAEQAIKSIKIAAKKDEAARKAAQILSAYLTIDNKKARDLSYKIFDMQYAMKRNSYGKAIFTTIAGGVMLAGMQTGAYFLDNVLTEKNEDKIAKGELRPGQEDQGKGLVGAMQVMSVAYALPIAIGIGNFGKRIGMGIEHNALQKQFKALTGKKLVLPKIPKK